MGWKKSAPRSGMLLGRAAAPRMLESTIRVTRRLLKIQSPKTLFTSYQSSLVMDLLGTAFTDTVCKHCEDYNFASDGKSALPDAFLSLRMMIPSFAYSRIEERTSAASPQLSSDFTSHTRSWLLEPPSVTVAREQFVRFRGTHHYQQGSSETPAISDS